MGIDPSLGAIAVALTSRLTGLVAWGTTTLVGFESVFVLPQDPNFPSHVHDDPPIVLAVKYQRMNIFLQLLQAGAGVYCLLLTHSHVAPLIHSLASCAHPNSFSCCCLSVCLSLYPISFLGVISVFFLNVAVADLDARTSTGRTALHFAAATGLIPFIELLVVNGASVFPLDKYGDTPLHLAAASGHPKSLEWLLSYTYERTLRLVFDESFRDDVVSVYKSLLKARTRPSEQQLFKSEWGWDAVLQAYDALGTRHKRYLPRPIKFAMRIAAARYLEDPETQLLTKVSLRSSFSFLVLRLSL